MTVLSWETANAANGPKVVRWLERRGKRVGGKPFTEWRRGTQAMLDTLDRVLVARGIHLSELPDDVWELRKPRPGRPLDPHTTGMVLAAFAATGSKKGAARAVGVPTSTARSIIERATA